MLADILAAVPVPLLAVDAQGWLVAANAPAERLLGGLAVGRPFVATLRHAGVNAALDAVLGQGPLPASPPGLPAPDDGVRLHARLPGAGGELACDVTVAPLAARLGAAALITIEDRSSVETADQMRRDFVANVSHELRTPLTALTGFIETLRGPARDDPAARARFLEIMAAEAGRMNRLVQDLLSLSRVEAQERSLPATRADIAALIRGAVAVLGPQAAAAGVALAVEGAGAPVRLAADADQITQVLHNLIGNAITHGGSGGEVRVRLYPVAHEPVLRGPGWAIEVSDRGEGIDPRHLPRLTERFYRVDGHRGRAQGGTGLGLAIVKHIVGRHRGRLRVRSKPGEGTAFTVILPAQAAKG